MATIIKGIRMGKGVQYFGFKMGEGTKRDEQFTVGYPTIEALKKNNPLFKDCGIYAMVKC